jgi:hypothetical protein
VRRCVAKYTINPALAQGLAAETGSVETGSVETGKLADLVLWEPAFFGVKPLLLLKGGRIAYAQMGWSSARSAPHGGDRFTLDARVEEDARLHVGSAAATLALPGQATGEARYDVRLDVAAGAELHWLPEPLISARGSDLRATTRADLAAGARLVLREEQVLGRAGERPGRLTSRLTVRVAGRTVLDQELACGPGAPGGRDGPAVLSGYREASRLIFVRPEFTEVPVGRADAVGVRLARTPGGSRRPCHRRRIGRAAPARPPGRGIRSAEAPGRPRNRNAITRLSD